ncbi:LysM peptidoglycan-binding domain-containing protein [Lachnoclostridium pacaense]|uniref:LysM peptidoglycan-binding domain-containing protein n=1 Tax=Enterocloster TaxID=2719313 RepID=UPI001D0913F4|nr:LysM peptidoglycan-binding domain-containing protein [Lachnoclostridium pacaense]MCB7335974.1 LysM peptidoglycan-binding domain-containing protein [Enterocloster aldenensis]MCC2879965.1 LysM peptidoglycan-binding domain-containing protein [Lachnoclostridium pacaense]DAQ87573.1 MAG TPA: tail assembly protein [Caudoviricetes sp.]
MAYEVYIDDMLLPVPPQKIPIKYPGQNKTVTLINGDEINLLRPPGLAEISLDIILPQMDYPSAVWDGSVDDAEDFISHLQDLKDSRGSFEFIVIRDSFDTNMDVTLEDYKVSDDVKEGLDLVISITMKEARHYGTKVMNFTIVEDQPTPTAETPQDDRPAEQPQARTYTVQGGDCLWNIAKKQLGDGGRWKEIHNLNLDKISNPNKINTGQVLTMP